ncbi:MAG: hypothetical protein JWM12_3874, partial [Ilumatobacteraceae bacterium]|nr:hypothetical protein [Ilumatobacteraceae bacterium]
MLLGVGGSVAGFGAGNDQLRGPAEQAAQAPEKTTVAPL